jgi:hypothetical protein
MEPVKKTKRKPSGAAALGPGPGRPKGVPNKVTTEFRETVAKLLDDNRENVGRWITLVAEGDGSENGKADPAKALDLLAKLAEYAAPKLSRSEVEAKVTHRTLDQELAALNAQRNAEGRPPLA